MAQEKEIEKKNLLTSDEFQHLCHTFNIQSHDFNWQANTYFDTRSFQLKAQRSALRVREKQDQYELTLKQPAEEGLLETNQKLNRTEADHVFSTGLLPDGEVKSTLQSFLQTDEVKLMTLGTLKTRRAQTSYKSGMLFLDHSVYLGIEDFEMELEGEKMSTVSKWLEELLKEHSIPLRPTPNKIQRFFTRKSKIH